MYFWGQIRKGKYDTGAYTNRQNNRLSSLATGADFLQKPSFLTRTIVESRCEKKGPNPKLIGTSDFFADSCRY